MDEITISGRTVEEAIEAGLEALGAERSEVDVEVVDEGVKGILGLLGTRLARVHLMKKKAAVPAGRPAAAPERKRPASRRPAESVGLQAGGEADEAEEREEAPARREPVAYQPATPAQIERAIEFLEKVCRFLGIAGEVAAREADGAVRVAVEGDQMGLLIGRRGQTLDALQYLTGLVANRGAKAPSRFVVDVEGYRDRREATLRRLAEHLATKVKTRGHRSVLEPMSSQERRVIHLALADDPDIFTYSEGEEPYRRVIIALRAEAGTPDGGPTDE